MHYFLCRRENGVEEVTASYDTRAQVDEWAEKQSRSWIPRTGKWYVKKAKYCFEPGEIVLEIPIRK